MRNLDGMEMYCFGRSKHFELEYGGKGAYVDPKGQPVEDIMDMACFVCTQSYYTRESDAIPFCPNCGVFEKKRFTTAQELAELLRTQDWKWLDKTTTKVKPFIVQKHDGNWELPFAKDRMILEGSGNYPKVQTI